MITDNWKPSERTRHQSRKKPQQQQLTDFVRALDEELALVEAQLRQVRKKLAALDRESKP